MKQLLLLSDPNQLEPTCRLVGDHFDVAVYSAELDLHNRAVVYWPAKAAIGNLKRVQALAKRVKEIKILVASDKQNGWHAEQALLEGWKYEDFIRWAKERAVLYTNTGLESSSLPAEVIPKSIVDKISELGLAMVGKSGAPVSDLANLVKLFERHAIGDLIYYDEFYHRAFKGDGQPWQEIDTLQLQQQLQDDWGFRKIGKDIVYDGVIVHARANARNEPRDWMNTLEWDQIPRIASFFTDCMGAEPSAYTSAVGHNFWVGLVARVFKPGCQNDHMVVLEGPQNIGKTSTLRIIGGKWYVEANENIQSKDFFMVLSGRILVEIAELDAFNRSEVNRIKQVISCPVDAYRRPYDRLGGDYPRTCVLVGTTNEDTYLRDVTGARRFWPIKCGEIKLDLIKQLRNQLFAEATFLFKQSDSWHIVPREETLEVQESRREKDEWEAALRDKLALLERVTISEAASLLGVTLDKLGMREQKRVAHSLRKAGFERTVLRNQGILQKTWVRSIGVTGNSEVTALPV